MNKDCFAYVEITDTIGPKKIPYVSSKCACLNEMVCALRKCSFYRPKEEWENENLRLYGSKNVEDQIVTYCRRKECI